MSKIGCDDGNERSGDGCSASCEVEADYECRGGDATHPDVCIERKQPQISLFHYFANRSAYLIFSERVIVLGIFYYSLTLVAPVDTIFEISLRERPGTRVTWTASMPKAGYLTRLPIQLAYNESLRGGEVSILEE